MFRLPALLLAGALVCSGSVLAAGEKEPVESAESAERAKASERWLVCTDAAVLPRQLAPIVARISARVEQQAADVLVNVVPQDEGSAEFLLASTSEVFAQLRNALAARKVPYRRVSFQWHSASAEGADDESPECRGVVVLVEVSIGG